MTKQKSTRPVNTRIQAINAELKQIRALIDLSLRDGRLHWYQRLRVWWLRRKLTSK